MRVRRVLATIAAVPLLIGLTAVPAAAGTGPSEACNDGVGNGIPILTSPITVSVEVSPLDSVGHGTLWVCYSTTPQGTPGGLSGGAVLIDVWTNTGTVSPGAYVALLCFPDPAVTIGPPTCSAPTSVNVSPGDVSVPPSTYCIASVIGVGCIAYLPAKVVLGGDTSRPTLAIQLVGIPLPVDLPMLCIAVAESC